MQIYDLKVNYEVNPINVAEKAYFSFKVKNAVGGVKCRITVTEGDLPFWDSGEFEFGEKTLIRCGGLLF